MIDPVTLLAFVPAALALNLTPGADMMFCLGQGLRGGANAAMAANFGIAAGGMIQVFLAGIGLGAAVAALPWAFDAIRWLGVGYLLWLAWGALRHGAMINSTGAEATLPHRAFRQALIVNLTNPKVILFVLAFIPQFVRPENGSVLAQFMIFGAILMAGGLIVNGLVGLCAGGIGRRIAHSARLSRGLGAVSAAIFGTLAVRLALMEKG